MTLELSIERAHGDGVNTTRLLLRTVILPFSTEYGIIVATQ